MFESKLSPFNKREPTKIEVLILPLKIQVLSRILKNKRMRSEYDLEQIIPHI